MRGLEFRHVTLKRPIGATQIYIQGAKSLPQPPVHLWIVPAKNDQGARGIGWNGVEYDLKSVGEVADWRADVQAALRPKPVSQRTNLPRAFEFSGGAVSRLFLERLGAPELMRRAALTPSFSRFGANSNDPGAAYLDSLGDAGVTSFVAGDFEAAKRQLQTLLAASPPEIPHNGTNHRTEATAITADIARRETDTPRPSDEIAGLIWDLQNLRSFGGWNQDRMRQKLIDAGDRAVEPLLETLENDSRLTLAVRRNMLRAQRFEPIATVRDVAQEALNKLLNHFYYVTDYRLGPIEGQKRLTRQMRADWDEIKGQTPTERVFKTLSQTGQTPERLEEAARELVRIGASYNRSFIRMPDGTLKADSPSQIMFGEPLRSRRAPSVSDLLEARVLELSSRALGAKPTAGALDPTLSSGPDTPDAYAPGKAMRAANNLALFAVKWEPKRAAPRLGAQLERAKNFAAQAPRGAREDAQNGVQNARRGFLIALHNTPFQAGALREYGQFLRSQPFGRFREENYAPLWMFPAEPAMTKAARALFEAPKTPFQSAATWKTGDFTYDAAFRLLQSPLVKTARFKAAIARALGDRTVIGQVQLQPKGEAELRARAWDWSGQRVYTTLKRLENGATQPLRVCDLVGFHLRQDRPAPGGHSRYYSALDMLLIRDRRGARLKQVAVLVAQGKVVADDFGINFAN